MENREDFKSRIVEEMTVSYSSKLEKNFELAKQFIRLTPEGTVDVLVRDRLPGKEQILLYLVGKMYAKEAGYVTDENVGNNELREQLGFPVGSLLPFLKELRDENLVRQVKRENNVYHAVQIGRARLNSSHRTISYAVFCLKKKKKKSLTASSILIPRTSPTLRQSCLTPSSCRVSSAPTAHPPITCTFTLILCLTLSLFSVAV